MADNNAPNPLDPSEFLTRLFESGQQMWAPFMGMVPAHGPTGSQGDRSEPGYVAAVNPIAASGAMGALGPAG